MQLSELIVIDTPLASSMRDRETNLVHRVRQKGGKRPSFTDGLPLIALQKAVEVWLLFVLGQHL